MSGLNVKSYDLSRQWSVDINKWNFAVIFAVTGWTSFCSIWILCTTVQNSNFSVQGLLTPVRCSCVFGFLKVYSKILGLFLQEIKITFRLEWVDVILQPKNGLFWKYRLSKNIF